MPRSLFVHCTLYVICILLLFSGCSGREGKAVLVLDRWWSLSREPEESLANLLREARRLSGMRISVLRVMEEDISAALTAYIEGQKPDAVLLGAFAAMRLRPVAESFPDVFFCVFDAPESGIPGNSPFVWVNFDKKPAMAELGAIFGAFMEGIPASGFAAAFLEPAAAAFWSEEPALGGPRIRPLVVLDGDTVETVRGQVEEMLALNPALYLVAAGSRSALVIDLIIQRGSPAPLILDDAEGLPDIDGFPVLASFHRDYATAFGDVLTNRPERGKIVQIPVNIRHGEK